MILYLYSLFLLTVFFQGNPQPNPIILFQTDFGAIRVELYIQEAPVTANHFQTLVKTGRYNNSCFYRVVTMANQPDKKVKIEVIQGGLQYKENIDTLPGIIHETTENTGIRHLDGTISMARNQPGSASSEFFICIGNQPELNYGGKRNPDGQGFAAFGKVIAGMDVVRLIQQLPADSNQILLKKVLIQTAMQEK